MAEAKPSGLILISTKETGRQTHNMDLATTNGPLMLNTSVNIKLISSMVLGNICGRTGLAILGSGRKTAWQE
jgi:hypothetical protein